MTHAINAVLASSGRKGTFMLLTALGSHPDVFAHDQVFSIGTHASGTRTMRECFDRQRLGIAEHVAIVLPASPTMTRPPDFWPAVFADRSIRVIHLRRRNMLRWYLSLELATLTGKWSCKDAPVEIEPAITIDPYKAASAIATDLHCEWECSRQLASHQTIVIYYEDLQAGSLSKAQELLGAHPMAIRPTTKKQALRPLREAILNIEELEAAWRGTAFETYLTGD
jgi:hypothetical protein